jgi:hypothetical protein
MGRAAGGKRARMSSIQDEFTFERGRRDGASKAHEHAERSAGRF